MNHVAIVAAHRAIETEGAGAPAVNSVGAFIDQATLDGWRRSEEQRHAQWVATLKDRSVDAAADLVDARGSALLVWKENGALRAQRVDRDHSTFREFVPAYLCRRSA